MQVLCPQARAQTVHDREDAAGTRGVDFNHLTGAERPDPVSSVLETQRTAHQPASGVVGQPPLPDAGAAGGVDEIVVTVDPEWGREAMELVPGLQPADQTAAAQARDGLV